MPLTMAPLKKKIKLERVLADLKLSMRLAALGLAPGAELEVLSNQLAGPFIIAVRGSRLVLSRGLAQQIMVK